MSSNGSMDCSALLSTTAPSVPAIRMAAKRAASLAPSPPSRSNSARRSREARKTVVAWSSRSVEGDRVRAGEIDRRGDELMLAFGEVVVDGATRCSPEFEHLRE